MTSIRRLASVLVPFLLAGAFLVSCGPPDRETAKLPFGHMDLPAGETTVRDSVVVAGWAIAEAGIKSVHVYVDRTYVGSADLGKSRPDIATIYPSYPNAATSGWAGTLDGTKFGVGPHELTAQAVTKAGGRATLGTIRIIVERPARIEKPEATPTTTASPFTPPPTAPPTPPPTR